MQNLFEFQTKAIEDLQQKFGALWNTKSENPVQLLLKAPTGSGKTVISTTFVWASAIVQLASWLLPFTVTFFSHRGKSEVLPPPCKSHVNKLACMPEF